VGFRGGWLGWVVGCLLQWHCCGGRAATHIVISSQCPPAAGLAAGGSGADNNAADGGCTEAEGDDMALRLLESLSTGGGPAVSCAGKDPS